MKLTQRSWAEYIRRLSRVNEKAGELMQAYLDQHGTADGDALIRYAYALSTKYGEGSAELACQMYDAVAAAEGVHVPPAEPAATASYGEVARLVNGTRESPALLQSGVRRMVKQAGADTTLQNALRDGAEFAWIPNGDTCPFCIALASRGWQRASRNAIRNGHAEHIHANCDCEYAIRFHSDTAVEGYDPERYLETYESADGSSPKEKINAMRRAHYAENRQKITAQKRAAYAARKASTNAENPAKIKENKTFEEMSIPEQLSVRPDGLAEYTPASLKGSLEKAGFEVKPLSRGRLKGIAFEDGGGYKTNFGPSGLLQYHPDTMSHHKGAYYKISTEEGGTHRYELDGTEKKK